MKNSEEINAVLEKVDECAPSRYPGMTYEQGVAEALAWVLENIPDDEFTFTAE